MPANHRLARVLLLAGSLAGALTIASAGCGGGDGSGGDGAAGAGGGGAGGGGQGGGGGAGGGGGGGSAGTDATFAKCDGVFTDMTMKTSVDVTFGGAAGLRYSPNCITVKKGTKVNWMGTFMGHPLKGASSNKAKEIPETSAGMTATGTFMTVGFHGYFCMIHGTDVGGGMAGNIQVVE